MNQLSYEISTSELSKQIRKRKTFAIISHPDAGKTTMTEKLLLFGNAIHMAGMVKSKKSGRFATSDWLEIEKQRGISVTSSVMQFSYLGHEINLLDTPGHQDFSEDTYRVLTAVDSVLMMIDSSKGIETQTKKLFEVCRERKLPIMTFMNKMDLEGRSPFDLIDEVEKTLNLSCCPMTWPLGQGSRLKGIYHLPTQKLHLLEAGKSTLNFKEEYFDDLNSKELLQKIDPALLQDLKDELELLEGAGHSFDLQKFLSGQLSPVFFGSAAQNFGVQEFLDYFLNTAPSPQPREAEERMVDPYEKNFSGVVFKVQANMDPKHRDRTVFVRICSGEFKQGMSVYNPREKRSFKVNNAIVFLSQDRTNVEQACAGDIIGIKEKGSLIIGDSLTEGENLKFTGIPQFSPELFCRVELKNPIKNKQLQKGLEQLSEEGASQIFRKKHNSEVILGVVGQLQFEVVKFRLLNEYGAEAQFISLGYEYSRWVHSKNKKVLENFESRYSSHMVYDVRGYPLILFKNEWEKDYIARDQPEVEFFSSLMSYDFARRLG